MYLMKSGILRGEDGKEAARVRSALCGAAREIVSPAGAVALRTDIRQLPAPPGAENGASYREYVLLTPADEVCASARPAYAPEDDPSSHGWPVCRAPRADHADVALPEGTFRLTMEDARRYRMRGPGGEEVLYVCHRGLAGGWDVMAGPALRPALVCGLFVFCRYLERENEFVTV